MDEFKKITYLEEDVRVDFNRSSVDREIRSIKTKINEIIRVINQMSESPFDADFDDDELEEMAKAGNGADNVFTPQEAQKILSERRRKNAGKGIIE